MEIGKVYKFRDNPKGTTNTGDWGREFIVTHITNTNFHYQVVGRKVIKSLNKFFWDEYVLGPAEVPVQFDSKLIFKFIR